MIFEKKYLFVGYGSIAKKHLNNLISLHESNSETLIIDIYRESESKVVDDIHLIYVDSIFNILPASKINYQAIFITSPTSRHYDSLKQVIDLSDNFFIEKPVFDSSSYDISFLDNYPKKNIYVACPIRHSLIYKELKLYCDSNKPHSIQVICSSDLRLWRKNRDYRETYSAHQSMGGGVDLDLIHEWDYVIDLLGLPQIVKSLKSKVSKLDIDSYDIALYIAKFNNTLVEIHLDYFGRAPLRYARVLDSKGTKVFDFLRGTIYNETSNIIQLINENDNFHLRELQYFLSMINDSNAENMNSIEVAIKTLTVAKG
jgi:predicted dehydrogenase